MIDTDKHQGHTKGDNEVGWRIVGDNFVVNDKCPNTRFIAYVQVNNDGEHTIVGFSDADAQLIADAPLLSADVKRLRGILGYIKGIEMDWGIDFNHASITITHSTGLMLSGELKLEMVGEE